MRYNPDKPEEIKHIVKIISVNKNVHYIIVTQLIKEDQIKAGIIKEYNTCKEEVFKRDDGLCVYCGVKVEHIRPQKLEPFFSLDPDYCISVCSKCHYKYGHKDECSTGNLAQIICI